MLSLFEGCGYESKQDIECDRLVVMVGVYLIVSNVWQIARVIPAQEIKAGFCFAIR